MNASALSAAVDKVEAARLDHRGTWPLRYARLDAAVRDFLTALSTPPADDVRDALDALLRENDGYWPQTRDAILAAFEVRPRGTVTDTERQAVADAIDNTAVITPRNDFLGGSTIANLLEVADAALETAREVRP